MIKNHPLTLGLVVTLLSACGDTAAPTPDKSAKPMTSSTTSTSAKPVASAAPTASAQTASAMPSVSTSAAPSTSASASAPLVPSETPTATAPTADEFKAVTKEIAVAASGEQKCSTKVLHGWFEINCGEADNLVRPKKVEIVAGFTKDQTEAQDGKTFRWVAALPSDGSMSQARMYGPKTHEIWVTLTNTDKGWKGALTSNKP